MIIKQSKKDETGLKEETISAEECISTISKSDEVTIEEPDTSTKLSKVS